MNAPAGSRFRIESPNRWAVLVLLGVAQLMVTLDVTIVNIALPSAQTALHFSTDDRQWIITAYTLSFGSLLLLGGKLGDLFGRKWTFVAGLIGFALASALGGLSQSFGMLVAARALQGVFGALLAPSALSLLTVTFADSPDRPKAFGIFAAIAGGGASTGLLLGGAITQALSWRWCLYVNLLIAVPAAVTALRIVANVRTPNRPRIDVPGVLIASAGIFAVVFGFSNAETHSWSAPLTIIALILSAVLLTVFGVLERRTASPLLPLHIVLNRSRGGAYALMALVGSGVFALFLFLTFYLQQNLGFTPLETGVGFLPFTGMVILAASQVQTRVLPRAGAKPVVIVGASLATIAMILLTRLSAGGSYASEVLPSLILAGLGVGSIVATAISTGTLGVKSSDAGIASAMVNTSQQVGGSVGTALLSTIFASAVASYASSHVGSAGLATAASIHGYTTAFWWAAGIFGVALLVGTFLLPSARSTRTAATETRAAAAPCQAAVSAAHR